PLPGGSGVAQAKAIAAKLAPHLAPLRIDTSGRGKDAVRTPEELATDLLDKTTKVTVCTSYEAAITLTAALRQAGQIALVAEIFEVDAPMVSADASILGRFVVALYAKDQLGKKPLLVLDPARAAKMPAWAGGGEDATMANKAKSIVPLDDATVVAHLYSQRAIREIAKHPKKPDRAYELSQLALKLAYKSATIHAARAIILAQAGQGAAINEALDEARKALALHTDAPRHSALGQLILVSRDLSGAQKEIEKAIAIDKSYWPAHQALATIRWVLGDREGGRKEIDLAGKIAPGEPTVMTLQASQLLADGEDEKGVALLRKAVAKTPTEQLKIQLYVGLIKANHDKEARALRKKMLAKTVHKDLLITQFKRVEDATGFDPAGSDDDDADSGEASGDTAPGDKTPDDKERLLPGMKLPDVKLAPPSGMNAPLKLPDIKLTP
ncbi:MAG: hypothetical protein KAI47_08730, partial [Deltaproteobacteria bacterium]|nr:hypothetical protein [Deltaproteobacteria bacterium]